MKIAFGYKMGSGKDASANYLINKYGGKKISFAEPIYDILKYAQQRCEIKYHKDRNFLQLIGTNWGRNIDPDIWVNLALKNKPVEGNIYCCDLRFKNEFVALKKDGWICVKLVRDKVSENRLNNGEKNHVSENELDIYTDDMWDYIIINNGSLQDLYGELDKIIKNFILINKNE